MKKIKLLLLVLTTLISNNLLSQNIEVINGKPFRLEKRRDQIANVLNENKNNFSFLTYQFGFIGKLKNFKVLTLNKELALESSKPITLPEVKGKEVKFVSSQKIGEKTYFFSRSFDKKSDTYTLYASELNVKTSGFDKHIEVLKVKDDGFSNFSQPFTIERSIDSTKILFTIAYPTKGKENAKYAFSITDNNLNQIWKKDVVFKELDKNFTANNFLVDKKGNLHITATIRMDRDEKKKKGAKSRYYVTMYSYFHENGELVEYEIGFKEEIIMSSHFQLNDKDELVCTGFYAENKFFDAGMKGFFFMRIDPKTKKVVAKNLSPFDKNFLSQLMSEKRAAKGKGLMGYQIRKTFNLSDGGMAVVCEYYEHYVRRAGNKVFSEYWIYGNVLVFYVDKDGKMNTYSILKKNQVGLNVYDPSKGAAALFGKVLRKDMPFHYMFNFCVPSGRKEVPYYGIGCMLKDDRLQLVYNENPKNAKRVKAGKIPLSVRKRTAETSLVQFERDGKINSNTLFKAQDKKAGFKMPVMPTFNYNYANGSMILIGRKGKNMRVVNVSVK